MPDHDNIEKDTRGSVWMDDEKDAIIGPPGGHQRELADDEMRENATKLGSAQAQAAEIEGDLANRNTDDDNDERPTQGWQPVSYRQATSGDPQAREQNDDPES